MQDLRSALNVREKIASFLEEDIGSGDITSEAVIPADLQASGRIICKSPSAIVSGLTEAQIAFEICGCRATPLVAEGTSVRKRKAVMAVEGSARSILKAERTALNMVMRMSGIATVTFRFARLAKPATILATRKTAPGLRYFDKRAVVHGGGQTHRMRLDDMVLIKDNHIAVAGSAAECVRQARAAVGNSVKVECEAKSLSEAIEAARAGADIVMLDNFTPAAAAKAIKELRKKGLVPGCKVEISGGVNEKNIRLYARAKPDFISLGYITHSPEAVDFSLDVSLP